MSLTLSLAAFVSAARRGSRRTEHGDVASRFGSDNAISRAFRRGPAPDLKALRAAADALRRRGAVSMLVMQVADIVELELLFGPDAVEEVVEEVLAQLTRAAGGRGRALRTGPDTFVLLMPGAAADELVRAVQAGLGRTRCIELELDGEEIILVPDVMARTVGKGEAVAAAYESVCGDLARLRADEQQRREYLRRERESHSRPGALERRQR
jgi:hypothetical protein